MAEPREKNKRIRLHLDHIERSRWRRGIAAATEIHPSAYRLATVLEDLMNNRSREAFAGQDELAELTAISVRQVRDHLKALEAAGWIIVLSGKDRTRPRSKRGLHYRPAWPDEATRERCMARKFVAEVEVKSGDGPPVLNEIKTGDEASLNRRSSVSKPAVGRRSHSNDRGPTDRGEAAQAAIATNNHSSHQLIDEENSFFQRPSAYAGPSEADEIDLDSCPNIERPEYDPDGPHTGDLIEVGEGAFVQVEEAEDDAGTPRDPDGLTADRRGDNAFDLAAFVSRLVASITDLSKVEDEPNTQTVLPFAANVSDATGLPIGEAVRLVEETFREAIRDNVASAGLSDEEMAVHSEVINF
ncbi:helix-turn-helix domain-containing protein [Pseudochrobactrum sp. B5]|uniref:helix-turn-helix domain-containing protein n=1 Tax=Pseudochrobactrum sp. B5 TaxID=1289478 RepID=UPI001587F9E1|nr:helix-turn-helix domain-containing protein [Pseudochrobactrum sp. B5]